MPDPVIGLHMIVRDEAETIERCMRSVLPHVDHAFILDTGSTDGTPDIIFDTAQSLRASVTIDHAEWPGDFALARQRSLDGLLERWPDVTHVLWLDGDDVLVGGQHLRAYAPGLKWPQGALLLHYAYAHDPAGNLACSHFRERLVLREAIDGWKGAVHEVLAFNPGWGVLQVPAPMSSGLARVPGGSWPVAQDGVEILHARTPSKDTTGRNREILERQVLEAKHAGRDPDPRALFYLGQEYAIQGALEAERLRAAGQAAEAHDATQVWLRRAVDVLAEHERLCRWDEERYQGMHRRADFLRALGDPKAALALDLKATDLLPAWPDAWLGAAESQLQLGRPEAALTYAEAGLAKPYPRTMLILNPTDYTVAAWSTRALALHALGRTEEALAQIREAAAAAPHDAGLVHNEIAWSEQVNRQRVKEALLALDEALARHDENLKAAQVLEAAPYFLQDDPDVAARLIRRRQGVRHVAEAHHYRRFYVADNPVHPIIDTLSPDEPEGFRDAVRQFCGRLPRAQFLLRGLREQAEARNGDLDDLLVADVGCNDGWLGWWLADEFGIRYRGWDLSEEAISVARGYADHFSPETQALVTFEVGSRPREQWADAVVCFEVIEHVPDLDAHLAILEQGLADDQARVYLSTPNGAYERGHISVWDTPDIRGHVRAIRPRDLAALCLDHGFLEGLEETQDNLVVAAYRPARRHGTVDFYLGPAAGQWSPLDTLTKGLGGSETMAVRMATRLAERGWRVRLYGHTDTQVVQGVEYLPWWLYDPTRPRDVLVASRCPQLIDQQPNARQRILWLHDADYPGLAGVAGRWDEVWCVGRWQADHLPLEDGVVRITRNGIPLDRYPDGRRQFGDRRPWVVYSSSPDRGLVTLLDCWDEIRGRAEAAGVDAPELHVAYGFTDTWRMMEAHSPHLAAVRRRVEDGIAQQGVVWHGALGQEALADLQQQARVWAYPTDFPEVSCITAMEAQAAGLAIVTSEKAELVYTVGQAGDLLAPPAGWDEGLRERFVQLVVDYLTRPALWGAAHERALRGAHRFDIEALADEWDAWLEAGRRTTRAALAAA